jgi:hypothetical protein
MGFRHTPFFNLLELLQQRGCPFCRAEYRAAHRYLTTTLYEFVNDPTVRSSVIASRGFCRFHAAELRRLGDPLGVSLLHETLLVDLIDGDDANLTRDPQGPCPACRYASEAVHTHMGTFLDNVDEPEIQAYLEQGTSICYPHLRVLARTTKNKAVARKITAAMRSRLNELRARVRQFVETENASLDVERPATSSLEKTWLDILDFFSGDNPSQNGSE